ncbi:hypothetical protein BRD00_00235 [Halobacteriales archaeon QS_8_69_26]|nr:MAG: hypothetical protein BRD00_00235 [Halobacteriales archaeon QS_8_69_26]
MTPDPSRLRDSTQIVVPCDELNGLRDSLTEEFTVTVVTIEDGYCRIIGSPVEIKGVSGFLAKHGITVP